MLTWAGDDLVVKSDAEGRCKPDKQKADEKIDPIVAMHMAYGEMLYAEEDAGPGAYASADCGVVMF